MTEPTESRSVSLPGASTLRTIEILGWSIFAVWAPTLIVWGILHPEPYAQGWRLVLELAFIGGRAVNIADGVANGFSRVYLLFQCGLQDVAYTLIVFPWIVRAYQGALSKGWMARGVERARRSAERHKRLIEPFGGVGLWLFIFFPFIGTEVITGSMVGFLLGMRTPVILAIALSSHLASVTTFLAFFETLAESFDFAREGYMRYLPWMVIGILLLIYFIQRLVMRVVTRGRSGA